MTSLREIAKNRVKFNESVENTVIQYLTEVKTRNLRAERAHRATAALLPPSGCSSPSGGVLPAQPSA